MHTPRTLLLLTVLGCASPDAAPEGPRAVALPPEVPTDSLGPVFPALDDDCRFLAFASAGQVHLHELGTHRFELVSVDPRGRPGGRPSGLPALDGGAERIAFNSAARLLAAPANRHDQVYVRDRESSLTRLVSGSPAGAPADDANLGLNTGLAISADGRTVAWSSYATNLVSGDRNASVDVFVRNLPSGTTSRASVRTSGKEAHGDSAYPALAEDGRVVAFASDAPDLVEGDRNGVRDVFVRDRVRGTTDRVSVAADGREADGASDLPSVSADGRLVAFASDASDLVEDDRNGVRDVFVHDRATGTVARASTWGEHRPDGASDFPVLSADGRRLAFTTRSTQLDPAGHRQVVVRELGRPRAWIASATAAGEPGDDDSGDWGLALSGDGRCVAFTSFARNLGAARGPALLVTRLPASP